MYTIVPINVISSGLSVLIPLYILSLHGNVFDVGIAVALYNLVVIPSSLIWGKLADKSRQNRIFVIGSTAATIPILLMLLLFRSIAFAYLGYAVYAIAAAASAPAINIMVMGTRRSRKMPQTYSRYGTFTLVGSLIAYAIGAFLDGSGLAYYLLILIAFNIAALVMSITLIRERRVYAKNELRYVGNATPVLNALAPKSPHSLISASFMKRLYTSFKTGENSSVYVLFIAIAFFALGYNLFNTSFIPYLEMHGLTYGKIFMINIANSIGQILILVLVAFKIKIRNINRYYTLSTVYRSTGYVLSSLAIILPISAFFITNVFAYLIAGFAFAAWSISSSVMLYEKIRGAKQGYYIGLWTAILGGSSVAGSLISGVISSVYGYLATFILAVIVTAVSGLVFESRIKPS